MDAFLTNAGPPSRVHTGATLGLATRKTISQPPTLTYDTGTTTRGVRPEISNKTIGYQRSNELKLPNRGNGKGFHHGYLLQIYATANMHDVVTIAKGIPKQFRKWSNNFGLVTNDGIASSNDRYLADRREIGHFTPFQRTVLR